VRSFPRPIESVSTNKDITLCAFWQQVLEEVVSLLFDHVAQSVGFAGYSYQEVAQFR
jgi:hypothetical protein